jgi:hypothetical protein
MTPCIRLLAASVVALMFAACGAPEDSATLSEDPGAVVGAPCASTAQCGAGEVCTTEDGVCNPPPGCTPGSICPAVCYGTCRSKIIPPPPPNRCRTDADCRKFSDYCVGCNCRALSVCQPDPRCPTPGVQCFVDPCFNKEAFCRAGACALRPVTPTCPVEKCGPPLGMPNYLCPDGKSVGGPTGRCLLQPTGACGWEVKSCPDRRICTTL